jgi:hypothetical protein
MSGLIELITTSVDNLDQHVTLGDTSNHRTKGIVDAFLNMFFTYRNARINGRSHPQLSQSA